MRKKLSLPLIRRRKLPKNDWSLWDQKYMFMFSKMKSLLKFPYKNNLKNVMFHLCWNKNLSHFHFFGRLKYFFLNRVYLEYFGPFWNIFGLHNRRKRKDSRHRCWSRPRRSRRWCLAHGCPGLTAPPWLSGENDRLSFRRWKCLHHKYLMSNHKYEIIGNGNAEKQLDKSLNWLAF